MSRLRVERSQFQHNKQLELQNFSNQFWTLFYYWFNFFNVYFVDYSVRTYLAKKLKTSLGLTHPDQKVFVQFLQIFYQIGNVLGRSSLPV